MRACAAIASAWREADVAVRSLDALARAAEAGRANYEQAERRFEVGLGTSTAPAQDLSVDAAPQADPSEDTLFDMISHALGEDKPAKKAEKKPAADIQDNRPADEALVPPADVGDVIRQQEQADNNGLVPPADVGETTGATQNKRKANSTLLDVLMGN